MNDTAATRRTKAPSVVIAGWAGAGNIGDELLARWVIAELRLRGLLPVLLSADPPKSIELHGVDSVDGRSPLAVLKAIRRADGLVFGPGGIVQDSSSMWNLPFHLWRPFIASVNSKPWVGVGLGVDLLERRLSRTMARRVIRRSVITTVRDQESRDVLAALGIAAEVADDVVFGLGGKRSVRRGAAVVALGPEIDRTSSTLRMASSRLGDVKVEMIASALDRVSVDHRVAVEFAAFRGQRDSDLAEKVSRAMTRPAEILDVDPDIATRVCGAATVVISSRYHAAVLAVAASTPTIIWNRSVKLGSLAKRFKDQTATAQPIDWTKAVDIVLSRPTRTGVVDTDVAAHSKAIEVLAHRIYGAS